MFRNKKKLLLGCHVGMRKPDYLLGSLKDAEKYNANAFMVFLGAPHNTKRIDFNVWKGVSERSSEWITFSSLLKNNIKKQNLFVHASYLINLANLDNKAVYEFSLNFFEKEIQNCINLEIETIILHPGSIIKKGKEIREIALKQIAKSLNIILLRNKKIKIALENMPGKGTQICNILEDFLVIFQNLKKEIKKRVGICLDTCHLFDQGYEIHSDEFFQKLKEMKIIEKVLVVHLNDSKNEIGSKKDRHENIGRGKIGLKTLIKWISFAEFKNIPKILETPYQDGIAPYKKEIQLLRENFKKYWNLK